MKIVFMGTPQAAVPSLERLIADGHDIVAVYTQPDRPSGRGNKITFSPVKAVALAHNISVLQPEKIRTDEAVEQFRSFAADVAIVVAYGRILPDAFLNAFPEGAINVHFSLLPKYRGAAPVNWAIVNGETETGVTSMRMDAGLDTGDILLQRATAIGDGENSVDLMTRLADVGAELLAETLETLSTIDPKPQDHSAATLAPILKKADGEIDWSRDAEAIADRIRGFQPFPGSFTLFRGAPIKIWSASKVAAEHAETPGSIVEIARDEITVACGNGTHLLVTEVQPDGKRRMPVRDLVNGFHLAVGEVFGK